MRFLVEDDGRVVVLPMTWRLRDLRGSLSKPAGSVEVERMNEAVRKRRSRS